jgi:hypothetical protein
MNCSFSTAPLEAVMATGKDATRREGAQMSSGATAGRSPGPSAPVRSWARHSMKPPRGTVGVAPGAKSWGPKDVASGNHSETTPSGKSTRTWTAVPGDP